MLIDLGHINVDRFGVLSMLIDFGGISMFDRIWSPIGVDNIQDISS